MNGRLVWQLIPVWQIRGYDKILDQRLEGGLSTYSEEDRIKYDPEKVYSIYVNALTGELVPVDYDGFGHIALFG